MSKKNKTKKAQAKLNSRSVKEQKDQNSWLLNLAKHHETLILNQDSNFFSGNSTPKTMSDVLTLVKAVSSDEKDAILALLLIRMIRLNEKVDEIDSRLKKSLFV